MISMSNRIAFLAVLLFTLMVSTAPAADVSCSECGMTVDLGSKFSAKLAKDGTTLFFCDIGDLFAYLRRTKHDAAGASVKDYRSGEWIDMNKALFVQAEKKFKTPMGWGIAAFPTKKERRNSGMSWITKPR